MKKIKETPNLVKQIAQTVVILEARLKEMEKHIQLLAKYTHHHPEAPVLGQVNPDSLIAEKK